ncbi:MAG: tetratricopeptide repeat protein [Crocinitomicaceae bacterium]|nr:tetratricopeptide repeat protein [Crocinitomicaceae bacterium]
MIRFFKLILIAQLLISGGLNVYSQTTEELRKQADAYFEAGQFVQATPIYSKLLAQTPRDYDINFRYGTCLLYNSHNKEEAIRYLSYSVKGPDIDKRAFYYLGRAYHLNYQFNDAIIQYEKFKSVANPAQLKEFAVDRQIIACKNGKKLLSNVTDMIVIQKTEIRYEDFYEIYKLNNIGGTILVTDEFQSKIDKQKGHRAVIHFPANSPGIYYSSYGEDGTTGLDIYVKKNYRMENMHPLKTSGRSKY